MSIQIETSDSNGCGCFTALALIVLLTIAALLVGGCASTDHIRETTKMVHDTVYSNSVVHDSVDRWHTHYEFIKGDTLHMIDTFWRDKWHVAHDTAYKTVVDVQNVEVEKVVEKKVYVWWPLWVALGLIGGIVGLCLLVHWWLCREEKREEEEKDIE
jgi:hypothetical protein